MAVHPVKRCKSAFSAGCARLCVQGTCCTGSVSVHGRCRTLRACARCAGCHVQGAWGCSGCCVPWVRVPPLLWLAPGGSDVPVSCPWGPVPAELLTRGRRGGSVCAPAAPCPQAAPLPTSKAVGSHPSGPAQIDKASLCHGDAGRLLWQRGEVRGGPLSCPARALSCSPPGFPAQPGQTTTLSLAMAPR